MKGNNDISRAAHRVALNKLAARGIEQGTSEWSRWYAREFSQAVVDITKPTFETDAEIAHEARRRTEMAGSEVKTSRFGREYARHYRQLQKERQARRQAAKVAKPVAKPANARPMPAKKSNVIAFPPAGSARRKIHSAAHRAAKTALASGDQRTAKGLLQVCQIVESGAVSEQQAAQLVTEMRRKSPKLAKFIDDGPEAA